MLAIIAQPDARDVYGWIDRAPDYRIGLEDGVAGLRVAFSPTLDRRLAVEADVAEQVAKAVDTFAALGAYVELADPDIAGMPSPLGTRSGGRAWPISWPSCRETQLPLVIPAWWRAPTEVGRSRPWS